MITERPRMGHFAGRLVSACLMLSSGGCDEPDTLAPDEPLVLGPLDQFRAELEPMLNKRCSSAACHASSERFLSLYAPGARRLDSARLYFDEPLSEEEAHLNAMQLAAFDDDVAIELEASMLLQKPLASRAGGVWHGGGDAFAGRYDPGYVVLLKWLQLRRDLAPR